MRELRMYALVSSRLLMSLEVSLLVAKDISVLPAESCERQLVFREFSPLAWEGSL